MAENPDQSNEAAGVTIGVVKETASGETRVGLIPDSVKHLASKGLTVVVEQGAGNGSSIADDEYREQGAKIVESAADVCAAADVVVRVQAPSPERGELDNFKAGQILVSFLAPLVNHELNTKLAESGVTAMAVDAVPRISRAQSMDALSAMSSIAGYKAVLMAADTLPKLFPLLMTAAGTIRPARVLVLGAGVAGLQAIATARRLGAMVEAYDTRAVVKEQVESLGAKFVEIDTGAPDAEAAGGYAREATPEELRRQQEGLNDHIARADVVITTALVPGRPAPRLIPAEAVKRMRHGSVIVDLAAETGGNCELTTPGEVTKEHGITIIGTLNLPATLPVHSSQMYAKVITNFLDLLIKDGSINLNFEDEIIANMCITHKGEVVQEQTRKMMGLVSAASPDAPVADESAQAEEAPAETETGSADDITIEDPVDVVAHAPVDTTDFARTDGSEDSTEEEVGEIIDESSALVEADEAAIVEVTDKDRGTSASVDDSALADTPADDAVVYVEEENNNNG